MDKPVGLVLGLATIAGVVLSWPGVMVTALVSLASWTVQGRTSVVLGMAAISAAVIGAQVAAPGAGTSSAVDLEVSDRAVGVIESMPISRPNGDRAVMRLESIDIDGTWLDGSGAVVIFMPSKSGITIGDRVQVVWHATPLPHMPPGRSGFVRSEGAIASANVFTISKLSEGTSPMRWLVAIRRTIADRLAAVDGGDTGALMAGLVTGDDSRLSEEARSAFERTGTGHITAVSGANVALLVGFWYRWLARGRRKRRWVPPGVLVTIWVYSAMTGLEPSAVRAAAVATLVILGTYAGRRADPMTSLVLVTAGLLLLQPEWQLSVGFWLSTAAAGALAWHMRIDAADGVAGSIRQTVIGLFMAQLATLPVIAWTFGIVTPAGIIANLILTPIMAVAFPLTFVFSPFAFVPGVSKLLLVLPAAPNDVAIGVVKRLADVSPVWHIDLSPPLALALVALPCLAVVGASSTDAVRWWHRRAASRRTAASR